MTVPAKSGTYVPPDNASVATWRDDARYINHYLHALVGARPCETACTHHVTPCWTLLGIANVAARNGGAAS